MYRFDPPQPGQGSGGVEPEDPYASTPLSTPRPGQQPIPHQNSYLGHGAPWGPPGRNKHPRGTPALILGILGICGLPVFGPLAWALSQSALKEAKQSPYPVTNLASLESARVLGIIGTLFLLIPVALIGLFFLTLIVLV